MTFNLQGKAKGGPGISSQVINVKMHRNGHCTGRDDYTTLRKRKTTPYIAKLLQTDRYTHGSCRM